MAPPRPPRERGRRLRPWPLTSSLLAAAAATATWLRPSLFLASFLAPPAALRGGERRCRARLRALPWEGWFGEGDKVAVPATSRQVVDTLKECMEASVRSGHLRLAIDLPPGLRPYSFDETRPDTLRVNMAEPSKERIAEGDLNVARSLVDMLKVMQNTMCVAFRTAKQAKVGRETFAAAGIPAKIFAFDGGRAAKRSSAFGGDAGGDDVQRFLGAVLDSSSTFVILVAPRAKQLKAVAQLDAELSGKSGDKTCIILVNARLRGPGKLDSTRERLAGLFPATYNLRLVGKPGSEGIVFHTTREGRQTPWVLATKTLQVNEKTGKEEVVAKEVEMREEMPSAADVEKTLGL